MLHSKISTSISSRAMIIYLVCVLYYIPDHMMAVVLKQFIIETLRYVNREWNHPDAYLKVVFVPNLSIAQPQNDIRNSSSMNSKTSIGVSATDTLESTSPESNKTDFSLLKLETVKSGNLSSLTTLVNVSQADVMPEQSFVDQDEEGFYLMVDLVITYMPGIVLSPLCGAWSDRHGRKLPLLLPSAGNTLAVGVYVTTLLWPEKLLVIVVVGALCKSLLGKGAMFNTILFSLAADDIPKEAISSRFACLLAWRLVGICVGSVWAAIMLDYTSVIDCLLACSAVQVLCFLCILVGIVDNKRVEPRDDNSSQGDTDSGSDLDESDEFPTGLQTVENKEYKRTRINEDESDREEYSVLLKAGKKDEAQQDSGLARKMLMATVMVVIFATTSLMQTATEIIVQTTSVPPLSWPSSWYGYVHMVYHGAAAIVLFGPVPCLRTVLPPGSMGDCMVLLIAVLNIVLSNLLIGLGTFFATSWLIFAAYVVGSVACTATSVTRSLLSRCVNPQSSGRAMGWLSVMETIAKVLGPMMHTAVYAVSVTFCPSLVYYVMTVEGALLLPAVFLIYRLCIHLKLD